MNVFPINGLAADGTCNNDQIQLMPGTLSGGHCGSGASLGFDGHKLVGTNGPSDCHDKGLEGASFQIRSGMAGLPGVTLTITKVDDFKEEGIKYQGYRIVNGNGNHTLCDYETAAQVLTDLGFPGGSGSSCPPEGSSVGSAEPHADMVVALPGPVYSQTTGAQTDDGSGFFNLACAGDALAKTAFYQIDETPAITTAALRMITARYGGSDQPFTIRGIPITVQQDLGTDDRAKLVPEALWDDTGKAMCLATPRLLSLPGAPQSLPSCLQPTGCPSGGCTSGSAYTQDLEAQLGIGSCGSDFGSGSGVLFQSWTGGDGTSVLSRRSH